MENTLPAFRRALRYADGVEFDVRMTKDGKLVLLHDGEFAAGGRRYSVRELTYRELAKLHPLGRLVPTLDKILDLSPRFINADLKDPEALRPLIDGLEQRNLLSRTVISTDSWGLALKALGECPDCRVGFSITSSLNLSRSLKSAGLYSIHVPLDLVRYVGKGGFKALLRLYRRKGLAVWLWNYEMDELALLPRFLPLANAVISDDPARLKRFISSGSISPEATHHVGTG